MKSDQRNLATAIEVYFVDHSRYPPCTTTPGLGEAQLISADGRPVPTFRIPSLDAGLPSLTTPISYLTGYPADPFAAILGDTYAYYEKTEGGDTGWIVFSPGPDGKFDLPWELYSPLISQPSDDLLLYAYDPTNGTLSGGDVFRVRQ